MQSNEMVMSGIPVLGGINAEYWNRSYMPTVDALGVINAE